VDDTSRTYEGGLEHVITLSDAAVALLERMKPHKREYSDLVFPGTSKGKELSDMTLTKVIRDMHANDLKQGGAGYLDPVQRKIATAHGFRSTFRTWAAEKTSFPREVAEAALAHVNPNKVEGAYLHTDHRDKRTDLLQLWGRFCDGTKGSNVVRLAV